MMIGFMTNPTNVISEGNLDDIRAASAIVGQRLIVLYASSETEISAAFATAHRQGVSALLVDVDTTFNRRREQVVGLAEQRSSAPWWSRILAAPAAPSVLPESQPRGSMVISPALDFSRAISSSRSSRSFKAVAAPASARSRLAVSYGMNVWNRAIFDALERRDGAFSFTDC